MSHDFARSQRIKKESNPRSPRRKKSSGIPSWLWMLVGTLVGYLIMFLVYLSGVRPPLPVPASAVTAPDTVTAATGGTVASEQTPAPLKRVSPVFEFYTKLPEGGHPVTDIAPVTQPDNVTPTPTQSPAEIQPSTPTSPTTDIPSAAAVVAPTSEAVKEPVVQEQEEELDPIQQLLAQKEKERKAQTQKPAAGGSARYWQAGVFRNKVEAEKLRSRMSDLGVSASIRSVNGAAGGDTLQKVLVGPFYSADEADKARAILSGRGISTIPVR